MDGSQYRGDKRKLYVSGSYRGIISVYCVRFHSHCTPEATFIAAGPEGIATEMDSYAFLRSMAQLLECRCGNGRLLLSTMGLQNFCRDIGTTGKMKYNRRNKNVRKEADMLEKIRLSILGDSFSTYKGWIPEGYETWYGDGDTNIKGVEETWWYQLMKEFGMSLECNCSYSGSTVCLTGYEGMDESQAFIIRMKEYFGEKKTFDARPDVILVEGGINDTFASPTGNLQYADWTKENLKSSLPAYCYMLDYLKRYNPQTRVICMISAIVSKDLQKGYIEACKHYNLEYLIFPPKESDMDLLNEGHPTTKGHRVIYEAVRTMFRDM